MGYVQGKAIEGGTPLSAEELDTLARDQIAALKQTLAQRIPVRKSRQLMDHRLAEELRLAARVLDLLEKDARRRGDRDAEKVLSHVEEAVDDVAEIIEAEDRCEALEKVDADMARRIRRRSLDGDGSPCDPMERETAANAN